MEQKQKKTKKTEKKMESGNSTAIAEAVSSRGRVFQGVVTKKFHKRVVIEFERSFYVRKYERFLKKKTRIHARLPDSMTDMIHVGDFVEARECRPLSKIIHFIVIKRIKSAEEHKHNQGKEMNNHKKAEESEQ